MLLLCALIVGSGSAWAEEATSKVTASKVTSSSATWTGSASESWSVSVIGGATDQNVTNGYAQIGTKNSPSTSITFSTSDISGTITEIEVDCASYNGLGTVSATVGSSSFGSQNQSIPSWSSNSGGTVTFSNSNGASGKIEITMTNGSSGRAMYIKSITVTYTSGDAPTLESVTVSGTPDKATYKAGECFDPTGLTVTATYSDESTKNVVNDATWEPSPTTPLTAGTTKVRATYGGKTSDWYTCITVNPTYTVTYAANGGSGAMTDENSPYVAGDEVTLLSNAFTAPFEKVWDSWLVKDASDNLISVSDGKFEMPASNVTVTAQWVDIPKYTAHFSVNGIIDSSNDCTIAEGVSITFPANPAAIDEKVFVGWVKDVIEGTTDTEPTFVTSATMEKSDITFYACFAEAGSATSASLTKMTSSDTFTADDKVVIVASDESDDFAMYQETINSSYVNKYTFDNNAATVAADDKNWFTVSAGSSTGTWKLGDATNGYVYTSGSNNLEISTNSSTDFTLAWNNTQKKFTLTGNSRWLSYRSDLDNKYFRMGGATSGSPSGIGYFDIYKFSSISYSDYCTTVVAAAVAKPVITLAENPFLFSTTATITCTTEGASIKYSFDGETWSDYSAALTITESKTIYAKAIKDSDESSVASATATKNLATPTVTVSGDLTVDLDGETNVSAGTLSAAVTYNDAAVEGASVTWSSSDNDIATIDASTGAVTLIATGEVTFTATYAANSDYTEATGTKTITIIDSNEPGATDKNPYTIAQARAAIDAGTGVTGVYVKGIVSQVDSYDGTQYITYWISDNGTTTDQFEVYKGLGIGGVGFSALTDVKEGDKVVVNGNIKKYNSTYEFDKGNRLVSIETLDFAFGEVSYSVERGGDLTITASSNNSSGAITYSSSATDVAEINASTGVVTAKKEGETTITATIAAADGFPGKSINVTLTVTDSREVANISFANAEVFALDEDGTYTQAATVSQSDYDGTITYEIESSTSDGALIGDATGELLFENKGTITVKATAGETATYKSNTATYTLKVRTTPTIVVADRSIAYNEIYTYDVASYVEGGAVTITSSNEDVVEVDEYDMEGIAVGTSTITVATAANDEYIDGSETFVLTVTAPEGSTTAYEPTVTVFSETFAGCNGTGGNDGKWSGNIASSTLTADKKGWVFSNGSGASACAKFGTGSSKGSAKTPALGAAGALSLSFKAGAWNGSSEGTTLKLSVSAGNIDKSSVTLTKGAFNTYTATITNATAETTITFEAANSSNNRFFLDDVVVTTEGDGITAKLNGSGYATFCSEYPLDFTNADGYTAWYISNVSSSNEITFKQITGSIKGGIGILLKGNAGETISLTSADSETELNDNKLFGTLARTNIAANQYYGLSGATFVKVNGGNIPAGKALLPADLVNESADGARLTFVFEEANGISAVESVKTMAEGYYNLQGQRIDTPKKGLYIVNGKKVIIK